MTGQFIPYKRLNELRKAASEGNQKAREIIDRYMDRNTDMDSLSRLMDDYYGVPKKEDEVPTPKEETPVESKEEAKPTLDTEEAKGLPSVDNTDDFSDLKKEIDGLVDLPEVKPTSFRDYMSSKERNGNRARKDANYFKAFDLERRKAFLANSKAEFSDGLKGKRRDIERSYDDLNSSLGKYGQMVEDMPNDDTELDVSASERAYGDLVGNANAMPAFGRSWDERDLSMMNDTLAGLVSKYGKKNVVAMLNTIREDGNAWKDYNIGMLDNAVNNYGKSLDKLLK